MELVWSDWLIAGLAAFLLGISKSGLKGIGIFIVTLMALVFGGRPSTGIMMPMLIFGDVFAVIYYNRHAEWSYIGKLIPWIIVGVVVGVFFGYYVNEDIFKNTMIAIILCSVGIMIYWEVRTITRVPTSKWFARIMGFFAGFTTMVGNLAGPFSNLYFLAMRLPKNIFIGTTAWLFFIVNLFKLPFHIWSWHTINMDTIKLNLTLIPIQLVGLIVGVKLIKGISDKFYRFLILGLTGLGAVVMLIR